MKKCKTCKYFRIHEVNKNIIYCKNKPIKTSSLIKYERIELNADACANHKEDGEVESDKPTPSVYRSKKLKGRG